VEEKDTCAFCDERPATHFSMDWDASLCDECEAAQQEPLSFDEVMRDLGLDPDEIRKEYK
jgi:hypothetical protein